MTGLLRRNKRASTLHGHYYNSASRFTVRVWVWRVGLP